MHKLYELKDKLVEELESYADNGKISPTDAEAIKYLASAADHIDNICDRCEEDEMSYYSGETNGPVNRSYAGGMRNMRSRIYRNSYARGRGSNARRDSMGRYSGTDVDMETVKEEVRRLAEKVEQM